MSQPFVGEIRMFGGNFAPQGWAFCNGAIQSIAQNDVLFALIGTTYGGDGQSTFALPDLRGRIPIHQGQSPGGSPHVIGEMGGVESVTLLAAQIPAHSHLVNANSGNASSNDPANNFLAAQPALLEYIPGASANATMKANAIAPSNGGQPHDNIMPVLAINYIISLFGIFPSRN